jgi:hypothetical protein
MSSTNCWEDPALFPEEVFEDIMVDQPLNWDSKKDNQFFFHFYENKTVLKKLKNNYYTVN